jgi:hypothetical protein
MMVGCKGKKNPKLVGPLDIVGCKIWQSTSLWKF